MLCAELWFPCKAITQTVHAGAPTMDVLFGVKEVPRAPQPLKVTTSKYVIKPVIMIL